MKYVYPAIFSPSADGYAIWFPDLPGTNSQGTDLTDSMINARNSLGSWLDYLDSKEMEIPKASSPTDVALSEPNDIVTLVDVDLDVFRRANNQKLIKKTLTIPGWLNELAEEKGINFSRTLKDALIQELDLNSNAM